MYHLRRNLRHRHIVLCRSYTYGPASSDNTIIRTAANTAGLPYDTVLCGCFICNRGLNSSITLPNLHECIQNKTIISLKTGRSFVFTQILLHSQDPSYLHIVWLRLKYYRSNIFQTNYITLTVLPQQICANET